MYTTRFLDLPPFAQAAGTVRLPGSKSISNRVLLLAGLSAGTTEVHDLLDSDDTQVMLAALEQLGCRLARQGSVLRITGLGGRLAVHEAKLFLGNAGTAMRPLTAALALLAATQGGDFSLSGVPRMHERPIGDLVVALRQLGCAVDCLGTEGYPPLRRAIAGRGSRARESPLPRRARGALPWPSMAEPTTAPAAGPRFQAGGTVREASIYALPYPDHSVDLVICCEVLEHLRDPAAGLAELARVADRHVLLSTPWEPVWRLLNLARGRYLGALGNTPGHLQHFSRRALLDLAATRLDSLRVRRPLPWTVILGDVRR